ARHSIITIASNSLVHNRTCCTIRINILDSHLLCFFFTPTASNATYTLSLHVALPIFIKRSNNCVLLPIFTQQKFLRFVATRRNRSEEHTSELQSRFDLVCRLLLEKKKQNIEL